MRVFYSKLHEQIKNQYFEIEECICNGATIFTEISIFNEESFTDSTACSWTQSVEILILGVADTLYYPLH